MAEDWEDEGKQKGSVIASLGPEMDLSAIRLIRKKETKRREKPPPSLHCAGGEVLTQGGLIPSPQRTHWQVLSFPALCPAGNTGLFCPKIKANLHLASFTPLQCERKHKGVCKKSQMIPASKQQRCLLAGTTLLIFSRGLRINEIVGFVLNRGGRRDVTHQQNSFTRMNYRTAAPTPRSRSGKGQW